MESYFKLPEEILLSPLLGAFPGREAQIRSLATLLHPEAAPCRNVIIHGTEATGKSAVTEALLRRFQNHPPITDPQDVPLSLAIVNSVQCITARHLFERIVSDVARALDWHTASKKCETLAQLTVELTKMLVYAERPDRWRFVLVLDSIDRQRDSPPTLLPGLARLSEIIQCLTCVFIVTAPPPAMLRTSFVPQVHFPNYTKSEFVKILVRAPPPTVPTTTAEETQELWSRFCGAVHDSFTKSAARTLTSLQRSCSALWPRFTTPIIAGTHTAKEFSKLLIASRLHFQDESLLNPSIVTARSGTTDTNGSGPLSRTPQPSTNLSSLLPTTARLLLLSAYLASHNAAKHDLTLFSTFHQRRKRRGGGTPAPRRGRKPKHRKIARKLLGAHTFVLERMMAIFAAVRDEWVGDSVLGRAGLDGDVGMGIATLASLRLLLRVGSGDLLDRGGKWRVNVGWEAVRAIGRSMGVEVEEWLVE